MTIGGVVRELHRSLLLALTAEPHHTTLTQLIKALGLLVANSPYHQLSEGYIGRVTASLGRLSYHKGVWSRVGVWVGVMVSLGRLSYHKGVCGGVGGGGGGGCAGS